MNTVDPVLAQQVNQSDQIDFDALFRTLRSARWFIAGFTGAVTMIVAIWAFLEPDVYRAEALLAPNDDSGASGLSDLARQYGGLASLAGIEFGGSESNKSDMGLSILESRQFIIDFITRRDLFVPLIAAREWDRDSEALVIDDDIYDESTSTWVRKVRPPKKTVPSDLEAYKEFRDRLTVREDRKTGFVTVAFDHYSPEVARDWLNWLVKDLNDAVKATEVQEAEQAITYLDDQLLETSLTELRGIFAGLIEEQTKVVMLANVSEEYLFRTLDPAMKTEEPVGPLRLQLIALTLIFGFILACVGVVLANSIFGRRQSPAN